jgi:site-specific DNA-methyltransferase (cytosine-N4-specific)
MRQQLDLTKSPIPEVLNQDSRNLGFLSEGCIDAIITSPPYATALPYLDTDRLAMYVLGLLNPGELKKRKQIMIGDRDISEKNRIETERFFLETYENLDLPGKEIIKKLMIANNTEKVGFRRKNLASTLYKYFMGMNDCISEMSRLLRKDGYCCIIIGNNHTKIGGREVFWINTHEILKEMAIKKGMVFEKAITMDPTSAYMVHAENMIQNEYILIFRKS